LSRPIDVDLRIGTRRDRSGVLAVWTSGVRSSDELSFWRSRVCDDLEWSGRRLFALHAPHNHFRLQGSPGFQR